MAVEEQEEKNLLICPSIRSRLFPFPVTAIFQMAFRKYNPNRIRSDKSRSSGLRSLVKSILIMDELSMTEYEMFTDAVNRIFTSLA